MKIKRNTIYRWGIVVFFFNIIVCGGYAQYPGSLMMFQDNFYAQMMDPAYMRTDEATTLAVPGLAGLSFKNSGSFKITDLITVSAQGKPELDFERFYNKSRSNNFMGQNLFVPVVYVNTPFKNGFFSFYYQERIQVLSRFNAAVFNFLSNGNTTPAYSNFSSEKINFVGFGMRDFAFGYAQKVNDKFDVGIRAKILFGSLYYSAKDWEFGITTSGNGDKVTLTSSGNGQMSFPITVLLSNTQQVYYLDNSNAVKDYLADYKNPGIAFDFGLTWKIDKKKKLSLAVRDLGGIWFRNHGLDLTLKNSYDYVGFDLENAVRFLEGHGYVNPLTSVIATKEDIRNVYRPFADSVKFARPLPAQTVIHYQVSYSPKIEFGITNQTVFQKKLLYNTFTLTAKQNKANLSVFESVNLQQLNSVSLGGGLQYTGKNAQFFLAADNLIAFYHPANNRTFSLSIGMCFLFNHEKNVGDPEGRFLPWLPFYRILD